MTSFIAHLGGRSTGQHFSAVFLHALGQKLPFSSSFFRALRFLGKHDLVNLGRRPSVQSRQASRTITFCTYSSFFRCSSGEMCEYHSRQ